MKLSYWEHKTWLQHIDYAVIGSGIVGLSCAITLRKLHPDAKIVVLERGVLPSGASTKNAGFACFGSLSEIIDDLKTHTPDEVIALVKQRVAGLQILRDTLGDAHIDFQQLGGYELFTTDDQLLFEECSVAMPAVNELLHPIFNDDVFTATTASHGFKKVQQSLIFNKFEGQIDTGKMMSALLKKAIEVDVLILNSTEVTSITQNQDDVTINTKDFGSLVAINVCIATNGFAKQFLNKDVQPARAQVLVTEPIENLQIKGTFHLDRGYYYFRNIDNRILLGGGRNLDFEGETTTLLEVTEQIQQELERLLKTVILPNTPFKIDHSWSGIMGVGPQKKPILEAVSNNVYCGVRLGGMGVAIGSSIGKQLAMLASNGISE